MRTYSTQEKYIRILAVILTPLSISQWLSISINSSIIRVISLTLCLLIIRYSFSYSLLFNSNYKIIKYYLIWVFISLIRGIIIAQSFWDYNLLSIGITCLSLPLFVFYFEKPSNCTFFLRLWIKYCIPLFFLIIFISPPESFHFYLAPFFFWGAFIPILPKKWKIISITLLFIMIFISLEARSQIIKSIVAVSMSFAYLYRNKISSKILKIIHWGLYIITVIFLYLGITGHFNIFKDSISNKNDETLLKNNVTSISADTRTSIYSDVINSAINNHYILFGRTPARGNDIYISFEKTTTSSSDQRHFERHINELCHPNIFTWLGLIGVILYSLIYFRASWLALYKSNSFALKILGCFTAFHWLFGWIEDTNLFNISNIILWMTIGICFSNKFRKMSDTEFKQWVILIFKYKYHK